MANLGMIKDEMIDLIIERQRDEYHNDLEPFDVYKNRLKEQYNQWWSEYFNKLNHGYEVILDVIAKERSVVSNKEQKK